MGGRIGGEARERRRSRRGGRRKGGEVGGRRRHEGRGGCPRRRRRILSIGGRSGGRKGGKIGGGGWRGGLGGAEGGILRASNVVSHAIGVALIVVGRCGAAGNHGRGQGVLVEQRLEIVNIPAGCIGLGRREQHVDRRAGLFVVRGAKPSRVHQFHRFRLQSAASAADIAATTPIPARPRQPVSLHRQPQHGIKTIPGPNRRILRHTQIFQMRLQPRRHVVPPKLPFLSHDFVRVDIVTPAAGIQRLLFLLHLEKIPSVEDAGGEGGAGDVQGVIEGVVVNGAGERGGIEGWGARVGRWLRGCGEVAGEGRVGLVAEGGVFCGGWVEESDGNDDGGGDGWGRKGCLEE
mmetsp:Transcript_16209/g.33829  ORF Transcript_16209/g.33829 Transcript_16209/m.33829 type:complete len:348 (-) Transcript_16209:118-1161(-)